MTQYLLDTNIVSHCIKQEHNVIQHLLAVPMHQLHISVITEAELLFGLAKRPAAKRLKRAVQEFLRRVTVLTWDRSTAECYGRIRAELTAEGHTLAPLDLLIAAQALDKQAIMVTNDQAFVRIHALTVEDWMRPIDHDKTKFFPSLCVE